MTPGRRERVAVEGAEFQKSSKLAVIDQEPSVWMWAVNTFVCVCPGTVDAETTKSSGHMSTRCVNFLM